ncbi:flavin reductase family protein [Streptomyces sp. NPDC089173]|uniref:flavin reductase family protein n=1 Tax=Streptomyces sp. NPDC089173 TaxID=3154965 RepID=UPI00344E18C4
MTANSFSSVSLSPPPLLVCVHNDAVMRRALHPARHFGVSVLSAGQEAVARHFADNSRPVGLQQFDAVGWFPGAATSVPLIDGALARFECVKWRAYDRRRSHDPRRCGGRLESVAGAGSGVREGRGHRGRSVVLPGTVSGARPQGAGAVAMRRRVARFSRER